MPQSTFGQLLKHARIARGLSQSEVAAPVLTKAFVSLLERDGARPSLDTLNHLADRLGHPVADLVSALDARAAARVLNDLDDRGRLALRRRRYAEARAVFEQLRDLAGAAGMPRLAAAAKLGLGESLVWLYHPAEAEPLLHESLKYGRRTRDCLIECRALRSLGLIEHRRGRLNEAVRLYQSVLALVPSLPKPAPVLHGEALAYLSTMLFRLARYEESLAAATDAIAIFEAHAPERVPEARLSVGVVYYRTGDHLRALEEYRTALRGAEQYEDLEAILRLRNNIGIVLIESGQPDAALEHLTVAVTMAQRLSALIDECRVLTELARCYLALGAIPKARAAAEQAVGRSHARGFADEVARASIVLGIVSVAERRVQKGLRYLTSAYRQCTQAGMTVEAVVAGHAAARVLSRCGKSLQAYRLHNEVFAALGRLPTQDACGVLRRTKTFDAALDRALDREAVSTG
ncbi:MAG TPA: tetratricopeptide repeat protein [bacterium]|nr:tetratricopeptide repeat protein [bacterium]